MYIYGKYYSDKKFLDSDFFSENNCFSRQQIHNKIQVFASKLGLNNTFDDMNNIQKRGVFVFEMSRWGSCFNPDEYTYSFDLRICWKEEKRNIERKDYSMSTTHSHIFFEIPIIRMFDEEKIKKWQLWAFKECKRRLDLNVKKRNAWLKKKKLSEDFEEQLEPNEKAVL